MWHWGSLPGGPELVFLQSSPRSSVGETPLAVGEEDAQGPAAAIVHFPAMFILQEHRLTLHQQQKLSVGVSCGGAGC